MDCSTAILATGGMDSTVLLYQNAHKNPLVITIDYGQAVYNIQEELLNYHIEKLNLPPLITIPIKFHDWQGCPGLFADNQHVISEDENPLEDWNKLRYSSFYVEGRNMIMVAYAMAYCSSFKIDELQAGYLYSEEEWEKRRSYKLMTGDNSPQFVDMINLMSLVGFSHQVRFRAPFYERRMSKQDVYTLGKEMKINYDKTYTCYFTPACGKCDNCLLRAEIIKSK